MIDRLAGILNLIFMSESGFACHPEREQGYLRAIGYDLSFE